MTDLMELDVTCRNASSKSVLSPSVGEVEAHSGDHQTTPNGAVETDTDEDEDEESTTKKDELLACREENSQSNGFASHSEDETEVADNDTVCNIESSHHRTGSASSPSSLYEVECDPIDTLKGQYTPLVCRIFI